MANHVRFRNLDEVMKVLEKMKKSNPRIIKGQWDFYQHLIHCSDSIEYSMTGYPSNGSPLTKATIGPIVNRIFQLRGFVRHDTNLIAPGAKMIPPNGIIEGIETLELVIEKFDAWKDPLIPHYFYGILSKKGFEKTHAMHIANHFESVKW